jgi:hypothetical protein
MSENSIYEIEFISPCPVQDCPNKGKKYRWLHTGCGGVEMLNYNGELRCVKCPKKGRFIDWKFNCGMHDYQPFSLWGIVECLSVMSQLHVEGGLQEFVAKTTQAVMKQFLEANGQDK